MAHRLALAGLVLASCSKGPPPLAACDELVTTLDRAAACPAISSDARTTLSTSARTMRATVAQISEAGGPSKAPAQLVATIRDACRAQLISLRKDPQLAACLK